VSQPLILRGEHSGSIRNLEHFSSREVFVTSAFAWAIIAALATNAIHKNFVFMISLFLRFKRLPNSSRY
jgi:hypothetical protein